MREFDLEVTSKNYRFIVAIVPPADFEFCFQKNHMSCFWRKACDGYSRELTTSLWLFHIISPCYKLIFSVILYYIWFLVLYFHFNAKCVSKELTPWCECLNRITIHKWLTWTIHYQRELHGFDNEVATQLILDQYMCVGL